jgi:flagellar operon protein
MNNMINNNINSIERMAEVISKRKKQDVNASYDGPSFTEILSRQKSIDELVSERTDVKKAATGQIRFTKHADARLTQRDIRLTDEQMTRLEEGTKKASDKGIKESLVLVDDLAFIVNTDKKMVITAIDQNSSEDNIYTNIDGAVII